MGLDPMKKPRQLPKGKPDKTKMNAKEIALAAGNAFVAARSKDNADAVTAYSALCAFWPLTVEKPAPSHNPLKLALGLPLSLEPCDIFKRAVRLHAPQHLETIENLPQARLVAELIEAKCGIPSGALVKFV